MIDYMKMIDEYKRSKAELKKRIGELNEQLKAASDTAERTELAWRKTILEQELYELECVMYRICRYTERGVKKNAEAS